MSAAEIDAVVEIRALLEFWFGAAGTPEYGRFRPVWFRHDAAFDAELAGRFGRLYILAESGALDPLLRLEGGALALVLLLDQLPRNLFRGLPRAFATDAAARRVARFITNFNHDRHRLPTERLFLYLPFEHSESIFDQMQSVALFHDLGNAEWTDYAVRHRDIVARFGRFPHRNAALGRPSTPEEIEFLKQPGSSF